MSVNYGAILGGINMAVGAYSDYKLSKTQFEMDKASKEHNEYMRKMQYTLVKNTEADDRAALHDQAVNAAVAIGITSKQDKANAEVSAAAAGVAGSTIEGTARGLEQSFLRAHSARKKNERAARRQLDKQALNTDLAHIFGRDVSQLSKPSVAASALGLGVGLVELWDENQPEGMRIADRLGRLGT